MTLNEKEEYELTIKNMQSKIDYLREQRENLTTYAKKYKPLTAMEVYDVVHDAGLDWHKGFELGEDENRFVVFARAIEAAHGIK